MVAAQQHTLLFRAPTDNDGRFGRDRMMVEPKIKPQESGNRCDCTYAAVSDGEDTFSFTAVDKSFELSVKPYTDFALSGMVHRSDEVRTGTYVTISAF